MLQSGTRVAVGLSTMNIMPAISEDCAANNGVPNASDKDHGPDAAKGASDAAFNKLMTQFLGPVSQNNGQGTPDTSQNASIAQTGQAASNKDDGPDLCNEASDTILNVLMIQLCGAIIPNKEQSPQSVSQTAPISQPGQPASSSLTAALPVINSTDGLAGQTQAPASPAGPYDDDGSHPILSALQRQGDGSATDKTTVSFSRQLKAGAVEKDQEKLSSDLQTHSAGSTSEKAAMGVLNPVQNDNTEKNAQNMQFTLLDPANANFNDILLQDTDAQAGGGQSDDGSQKKEQIDPSTANSDFTPLMNQNQAVVQGQPALTQSERSAGTSGNPAPVPQHATDMGELTDRTASIVKDGNRLAVKLEPDGLGKLDINLILDKGMVSAQIHVSNDATKNLIENNMQQMMNALTGEGLSVGGFTVSMNQKESWDGTAGEGQNGGKDGAPRSLNPVAAASQPLDEGLVNIFV